MDSIRRRLEQQRKKVKQLRGRTDIHAGIGKLRAESANIPHLRSRSRDQQCGSDVDSEDVNLDSLRKDKKLRH